MASPGAPGENAVLRSDGTREVVPGNSESQLAAGDAFEMLTPGIEDGKGSNGELVLAPKVTEDTVLRMS